VLCEILIILFSLDLWWLVGLFDWVSEWLLTYGVCIVVVFVVVVVLWWLL